MMDKLCFKAYPSLSSKRFGEANERLSALGSSLGRKGNQARQGEPFLLRYLGVRQSHGRRLSLLRHYHRALPGAPHRRRRRYRGQLRLEPDQRDPQEDLKTKGWWSSLETA